jgi:hypothetical protein
VLLFTRDVQEALEWFALTHQLVQDNGGLRWQRTSLPAAGGLEDQPARLMETLALIACEENAVIRMARQQGDAAGAQAETVPRDE